jgi:putative membrane protein
VTTHHYRPRRNRRRAVSGKQTFVLYLGLLSVIGLQIAYPLVHGDVLRDVTLATVFVGAATMVLHSYLAYGPFFAIAFSIVTFIYSLAIETIGVKSGWPFGRYHYDHSLGVQIFGVPLLVPFAWMMLSYPILIAARRAAASWVFLYGGIGLMIWDLFLDPQMVDAGRWSWKLVGPHVPYEPMIPLSNAAGWLFAGMGLMALLHRILPQDRRKKSINSLVPDILLFWTLIGGVLGNIFFFHHTKIAQFVGIVFAIYLIPYIFQLRFGRPDTA